MEFGYYMDNNGRLENPCILTMASNEIFLDSAGINIAIPHHLIYEANAFSKQVNSADRCAGAAVCVFDS